MYSFNPQFKGVNIIGGEVCMWGELTNSRTQDQKIWIRASILAERLWNVKVDSTNIRGITERLVAHSRRMKSRGFKHSAVTVELCEHHPDICF